MTRNKPKITSLQELQARKAELKQSMTFTREATEQSLTGLRDDAPTYLLTKVGFPAALAGLAAYGLSRTRKSEPKTTYRQPEPPPQASGFDWLGQLLPLVLPLIQGFFTRKKQE